MLACMYATNNAVGRDASVARMAKSFLIGSLGR